MTTKGKKNFPTPKIHRKSMVFLLKEADTKRRRRRNNTKLWLAIKGYIYKTYKVEIKLKMTLKQARNP